MALKQLDPSLKVGAPGMYVPSNRDFARLERFFTICQQRKLPLDLFSWHFHQMEPEAMLQQSDRVQCLLDHCGFPNSENLLTEWSPVLEERFDRVQHADLGGT